MPKFLTFKFGKLKISFQPEKMFKCSDFMNMIMMKNGKIFTTIIQIKSIPCTGAQLRGSEKSTLFRNLAIPESWPWANLGALIENKIKTNHTYFMTAKFWAPLYLVGNSAGTAPLAGRSGIGISASNSGIPQNSIGKTSEKSMVYLLQNRNRNFRFRNSVIILT